MNQYPIAVGVLGASGYSGRELIALLARHGRADVVFATSESEAGRPLRGLCAAAPELALVRAEDAPLDRCDVVFSCLPHGHSGMWAQQAHAAGARVIDLSSDLRIPDAAAEWARDAVYGLPELHRDRIAQAAVVANPGCYPTAALLALAPLLRRGMIAGPVVINAASGVTGAGRSPRRDLLFAEVAEDFRAYGIGNTHRHLAEMRHQVGWLANGGSPDLVFVPHLLPVQRGILETIHVPLRERLSDPLDLWLDDYGDEPFVEVLSERMPSLRDVVGTNRVAIGVAVVDGVSAPLLQVVAAIDNLRKGASGQAVQNLNLMYGLPETEALL
jgi:N-acetyl-gamma-glutamyl-phosphate reductase